MRSTAGGGYGGSGVIRGIGYKWENILEGMTMMEKRWRKQSGSKGIIPIPLETGRFEGDMLYRYRHSYYNVYD